MGTRWVRVAITATIGFVVLLAWSPSAQAAFGLTDLTAEPGDPAAGANSDFNIALQITDPGSDLKKLKAGRPVKRFAALLAEGAVQPGKGLSGHAKLRFKLKVRDVAGKRTKLTVRAK
jgi:hypothetical protein